MIRVCAVDARQRDHSLVESPTRALLYAKIVIKAKMCQTLALRKISLAGTRDSFELMAHLGHLTAETLWLHAVYSLQLAFLGSLPH